MDGADQVADQRRQIHRILPFAEIKQSQEKCAAAFRPDLRKAKRLERFRDSSKGENALTSSGRGVQFLVGIGKLQFHLHRMHEEACLPRDFAIFHSLFAQGGGKACHLRAPEAVCRLAMKLLQGRGTPPDITGTPVGREW